MQINSKVVGKEKISAFSCLLGRESPPHKHIPKNTVFHIYFFQSINIPGEGIEVKATVEWLATLEVYAIMLTDKHQHTLLDLKFTPIIEGGN